MVAFIIILFIILLAVLGEIHRELSTFQVTRYIAAYDKLNDLPEEKRVVFLSDLHSQVYDRNNDSLFQAVQKEQPDLILVGGDMFVGKPQETAAVAISFLKRLPALAPVYYANGNHEQRVKEEPGGFRIDYADYRRQLTTAGIRFLENESLDLDWGGLTVRLTGLEIPGEHYRHFSRPQMAYAEIADRIGAQAQDGYNILLAHNPAFIDYYKQWGADLILSGHFHGGLIRIPGLRGLIIPGIGAYKKYSGGIYLEGDKRIIVSKGLGSHTIKLRLFNKAEVVSLRLCGKNRL